MRTPLLALLTLALTAGPAVGGPRETASHALGKLAAAASAVGYSGAVLVAQDGDLLLRQGYGLANRGAGTAITPGTVFDIGSITKQFTAAAILQLEVQGKLDVQQPVATYLDSVPPDKAGITLHQVLTHTAGLPEYSGDDYDAATRDATVARILATPLEPPPGTAFAYSNAGYSILAAIVERVSGQPYERFLAETCFRRAGMQHTGYRLPKFDPKTLPHGYEAGADLGSPLDHLWASDGPYWNLFGNGGMLSTVDDLHAWVTALQGDTVLPEAARRKLFTPNLREYAYGWNVRDTPHGRRIFHGGTSDNGFNAIVIWYPEHRITIVATSNAGANESGLSYAAAVGAMLERRMFDATLPDVPALRAVEVPQAALQAYAGTYRLPGGGTLTVELKGSRLLLEPTGQEATNLLVLPAATDPAPYDRCSEKAAAIVAGVLKRDFALLRQSIPDSARAERLAGAVSRTLKNLEDENGPVEGFNILGTTPAWWTTGGDLATLVRLRAARGTRIFRLHWQDGYVTTIGGGGIPSPARTPLVPGSATAFTGFHLGLARAVQVQFLPAGRDGAATMQLTCSGRTAVARRVP